MAEKEAVLWTTFVNADNEVSAATVTIHYLVTPTAIAGNLTKAQLSGVLNEPVMSRALSAVSIPVTSVFGTTEQTLKIGETADLSDDLGSTPALTDASGSSISWESSDEDVATVDPVTGVVTAVAPGEAVITATATNGGQAVARIITVNVVSNTVIPDIEDFYGDWNSSTLDLRITEDNVIINGMFHDPQVIAYLEIVSQTPVSAEELPSGCTQGFTITGEGSIVTAAGVETTGSATVKVCLNTDGNLLFHAPGLGIDPAVIMIKQ